MIGQSQVFRQVVATIEKIATYDVPVLVDGETGTGKELVARAIHYQSRRAAHPFVPVNCGALPETLIENELFGHRRGAFTDAREHQLGLVALANAGTLFLDEVDALPPKGQVALLRFLQERVYRPIGDAAETCADVRIIAASNRDLAQLSEAGVFRTDLLYRLRFFHVRVPPLRERSGDPRLLAAHFVSVAANKFQKSVRPFAPDTLAWFDRHHWPGNVRELEHLVCREFLLCEGDAIHISRPPSESADPGGSSGTMYYREAKACAIAQFEMRYLGEVMEKARGNVSVAARLINTDRRHLGRLLKKYGIRHPPA